MARKAGCSLSSTTNCIEAEAHALVLRKLGRAIARQWLFTGGLPVVRVLPAEEQRAREILARHTANDWRWIRNRASRSSGQPRARPHRHRGLCQPLAADA